MRIVYSVVLDTNVILSALRSRRGKSFALLETLGRASWQPVVSTALALEYEDVLKRPDSGIVFSAREVDDFLDYFFQQSRLVGSVYRLRPALPDPDDDRILELAVRARASIVTFNRRDFRHASRFGILVLTPGELIEKLESAR